MSTVLIELLKTIQMDQIHHIKPFKCNKTEFDSIEPNSKKHRNIEKIRIPRTLIRFGKLKVLLEFLLLANRPIGNIYATFN